MKKNIEASNIELLEIFLPTFLVIKNYEVDSKEIFEKITVASKIILKDININSKNNVDKMFLKKEILKTISSLISANIIYFKDESIDSIITDIKSFFDSGIIDDFSSEEYFIEKEKYIYLLPIFKEIKTFHLGLYYADIIDQDKKFILEENLINHIISSMLKLDNVKNKFFTKELKLKTKLYKISLVSCFENILKNDKILNEYIKNQNTYIKEIDLNYKKTFKELEKTIEYIIN